MPKIIAKDCSVFSDEGDSPILVYAKDKDGVKIADSARANLLQKLSLWKWNDDNTEKEDDYVVKPATYQDQGLAWWAGRYIGRVKVGQTTIEIRPRFGENFLLCMVEEVYNFKYHDHDASLSNNAEWDSSLLKLIRNRQWLHLFEKANRYGLPFHSVRNTYYGYNVRGQIDISKTIMSWRTQRKVHSSYFDKQYDDVVGSIVFQAYRILFGHNMPSLDSNTMSTIHLLNSLYNGRPFQITENEYKNISYKSIFKGWKSLVDFSWSVIRDRQLSYDMTNGGKGQMVLVDMAEIWEAFLRKRLGEALANDGWKTWSVEECKFKVYKGQFYERQIIPDIIFEKNGKFMVFDAKYKRMKNFKDDVDRSDFFQIHTYIQYMKERFGSDNVLVGGLLYPLTTGKVHPNNSSSSLFGLGNGGTKFMVDGIKMAETTLNSEELNKQLLPTKEQVDTKEKEIDEKIKDLSERILQELPG